uniref:Ovule protein n=1 Tax=Steinernema glaseri TaxID=37863 RepID=A0A1I8ABI3_9BILA
MYFPKSNENLCISELKDMSGSQNAASIVTMVTTSPGSTSSYLSLVPPLSFSIMSFAHHPSTVLPNYVRRNTIQFDTPNPERHSQLLAVLLDDHR